MLKPRYYQRESVDAVYEFWAQGGGNPIVVLPTGAGKSLVIAMLCMELLAQYPSLRIGVVTHVQELIAQNAQEMIGLWPDAPIGVYSAGLGKRQVRHRITFMGIQSVYNKAHLFEGFDVMLVDEAHLMPRSSEAMYGRFISDCRKLVPDMRIVGLTANDYRLDSGRLTEGEGAIFDKTVYEVRIGRLIEEGYLSPLIGVPTVNAMQTDKLRVVNGDYAKADMEIAAKAVEEQAVAEIVEKGAGREGWLIFCPSVDIADRVRELVRKHGVSCETVTGETDKGERKRIIQSFVKRQVQCLTSVGVLTTGFNAKHVDLLAMLRPTKSPGLYLQMVGRAFRPLYAGGFDLETAEGRRAAIAAGPKPNALILDFAGNVKAHGPVDQVRPPPPKKEKAATDEDAAEEDEDTVSARMCPECMTLVERNVFVCSTCHYEWPAPAPKHAAQAEDVAVLSTEAVPPKWLEVWSTSFRRHVKPGSRPSLRLTIGTPTLSVRMWLCFDHQGFALRKAHEHWRKLGGQMPPPPSTDTALARLGELRRISEVLVKTNTQFPEVLSFKVDETEAAVDEGAADEPHDVGFGQPNYEAILEDEVPF